MIPREAVDDGKVSKDAINQDVFNFMNEFLDVMDTDETENIYLVLNSASFCRL